MLCHSPASLLEGVKEVRLEVYPDTIGSRTTEPDPPHYPLPTAHYPLPTYSSAVVLGSCSVSARFLLGFCTRLYRDYTDSRTGEGDTRVPVGCVY